jgi:tyrosinase
MAGTKRKAGVLKRPATPPPIRTRKSVATLSATDPIIVFYERAIREMESKPIADPMSWRYQAAIHDYVPAEDPNRAASDVLPSAADQTRFWRACQHGSWFFLPWHRMYLHHFERIVMGHVARLGGPSDWALPYWNYSASTANAARLPAPFQNPTLADGSRNRLFVAQRDPRANANQDFISSGDNDITGALAEPRFAGGANNGFGGARVRSHDGSGLGVLEITPHGLMHMAVGGRSASGWMTGFTTAPLDPIFWLHHCNIDRLWKVWRRGASTHTDPTERAWLDEPFEFHDALGNAVTMSSKQVVDTRAAPLLYRYDDDP